MAMRRLYYLCTLLALLVVSCAKHNDMVIDKDEMASLMADIHVAEAYIDLNHDTFTDDSAKQLLKQSIYAAHGVTPEQVDSSYKWYGYHIEDYMEVYDKTISILNDRQQNLLSSSTASVVVEGDSVNIWPLSPRFEFSRKSAARIITFEIPSDSNWYDRDVFTLRFNMVNSVNPVIARMVVEYADGSTAYNLAAGKNKGFGEVSIRIDSARTPQRLTGYIWSRPEDDEVVRLDSISLVKMRKQFAKNYFSQRPFNYNVKVAKPASADTVAHTTDSLQGTSDRQKSDPRRQPPMSSHRTPHAVHTPQSTHRQATQPAMSAPAKTAPRTGGGSAAQEGVRQREEMYRAAKRK